MIEKDAIEELLFLKGKLYNGILRDRLGCIDIAIAALEKQIPKKVIKKIENVDNFKTGYCACPNCGKWVVKPISRNGCNNCLQRLDWSDI